MSAPSIIRRSALLALAASLGTAGVMAGQAPVAQAARCEQWGWPGAVTIFMEAVTDPANALDFSHPIVDEFSITFNSSTPHIDDSSATINGLDGRDQSIDGRMSGIVRRTEAGPGADVLMDFYGLQGINLRFGGGVYDGIANGKIYAGSFGDGGKWITAPAMVCLEEPAAAAQAPAGPAGPAAPAGSRNVTVNGDVDVHDVPGGGGTVIGMLRKNETAPLQQCNGENWCEIQYAAGPAGKAWVWGDFLDK